MTKREWCQSTAPAAMLDHLEGCERERKLRLFAVACCRRHLDKMPDPRCLLAIETSERFADEMETEERLEEHYRAILDFGLGDAGSVAMLTVADTGEHGFGAITSVVAAMIRKIGGRNELSPQADLLRCIFGIPFRPIVVFDPQWLTSTVTQLAQGIYNERAFDRMPILADALQDAGCDNDDILNHCRDPKGIHARGCWVVDQILGKE